MDPLNVDHFSCTPLVSDQYCYILLFFTFFPVCMRLMLFYLLQMWACALGHTEAALVLYQWDPRALAIPDSLGRLPLNIARSRGHTRLAELLEQLQQSPQTKGQPADSWMEKWKGGSQNRGINSSSSTNPTPGPKASCVCFFRSIMYFVQD